MWTLTLESILKLSVGEVKPICGGGTFWIKIYKTALIHIYAKSKLFLDFLVEACTLSNLLLTVPD